MAISVVEVITDAEYTQTSNGISGRRKFISSNVSGGTPTDLPSIGDTFVYNGATVSNVYAVSISAEPLGGATMGKGICKRGSTSYSNAKSYTVDYAPNTSQIGSSSNSSAAVIDVDLLASSDISAEITSFDNIYESANGWYWASGQFANQLQLAKPESTMTLNLQRYVYKTSFKKWITDTVGLVGTLNNATFYTYPIGSVLYLGSQAQEIQSNLTGYRKWQVSMSFKIKAISGSISQDSWQKPYNPKTNANEYVYFNKDSSQKLYTYSDFSNLLKGVDT